MATTSSKKKSVKKASAKKAAVKKAVSKKAVAKKAVSKKAVSKKAVSRKVSKKKAAAKKNVKQTLTYQQRYQKIAEAAYLLAEQQNFQPNNELRHWLEAEIRIDEWIEAEKINLVE